MIERLTSPQVKTITLEEYRGIGKDILKLNAPVAGGFMKTADIRGNISVTRKDPNKIVKPVFLKKTPAGSWLNTNITEIRQDGNDWQIGINDQLLAKKTKEASTKITFDEQYITAFQEEISKGLRSVLKREKLLNSGKYNLTFTSSYLTFIGIDVMLIPIAQIATIFGSENMTTLSQNTLVIASSYIVCNVFRNGFNSLGVMTGNLRRRVGLPEDSPFGLYSNYEDPFIKHSVSEHLLPPVPVDKFVKGLIYLNHNQNRLLEKN